MCTAPLGSAIFDRLTLVKPLECSIGEPHYVYVIEVWISARVRRHPMSGSRAGDRLRDEHRIVADTAGQRACGTDAEGWADICDHVLCLEAPRFFVRLRAALHTLRPFVAFCGTAVSGVTR